jgi:[ribosomal protein S18]-alanine N-acetyltransferase
VTACLVTPLDAADLARARELAAISGSGFDPESELARSWARIWVARTEPAAAPVAWALVWRAADEAHLLDLAVDAAVRRGGVGRALLTHVVDAMREDGAAVVLLEVRASNAPAIGLYRSVGFSETSVRRAYYSDNGEDAIVMRLNLLRGTPA